MKITLQQAKNIILCSQLLDGALPLKNTGANLTAEIVNSLGYIQIDTIHVIKRAHLHVLWTRQPAFRETYLHDLQAKTRDVFEYWGHAMSYLPMSDYRYYLPRMKNFYNPSSPWARYQFEKVKNDLQAVLDRVRAEGPLSSGDFKDSRKKGGTWWDWKPAKVALELLFWRGELMVTERRNFAKVYDLTERVLPENVDTTIPEKSELASFFVRRALAALGIANEKEINGFLQPESSRDSDMRAVGKKDLKQAVLDLVETGEISAVEIDGAGGSTDYVLTFNLEHTGRTAREKQAYLLSPFDNLIIQRARTKRLFGFDYTLECYLPENKRRYGYFVLPILWGDTFAGRFDAKADRAEKVFYLRSLFFEPDFREFDAFLPALAQKLTALAKFNGCHAVRLERVEPAKIGEKIKKLIGEKSGANEQ